MTTLEDLHYGNISPHERYDELACGYELEQASHHPKTAVSTITVLPTELQMTALNA